jgi:arylsulfatase
VTLRRWPEETHGKIAGSIPAFQGELEYLPAGEALPVKSARLELAGNIWGKAVCQQDEEIVFEEELESGKTQLQTWFLDQAGESICGAYYVEVLKFDGS